MRLRRSKTASIPAAVNVLMLVGLLGPKAEEFDRLRAQDAARASGEMICFDPGAPFYVAGRPLYGDELRGASATERAYVVVNAPAIVASLLISHQLSSATAKWVTGINLTPSVWNSGILAVRSRSGLRAGRSPSAR